MSAERLALHKQICDEQLYKRDPYYFKSAELSTVALIKMLEHAKLGGELEIMGMLMGYVEPNKIIVTDCFALPVEGTETRVNAHEQAFAYMIDMIQANEATGRTDIVLGWYHSHPNYGCWLSGVDVATQHLHQEHSQDPFLAIVVDPVRTMQGQVEVGAFRTLPAGFTPRRDSGGVKQDKAKDYGQHADRYYELPVKMVQSQAERDILSAVQTSWGSTLMARPVRPLIDRACTKMTSDPTDKEAAKAVMAELEKDALLRRVRGGLFK